VIVPENSERMARRKLHVVSNSCEDDSCTAESPLDRLPDEDLVPVHSGR
jgi:hypothetical protein